MDAFPRAILTPPAEILVHRLPGRKVMRHHTPGAPRPQNIQDAVNYLPKLNRMWPSCIVILGIAFLDSSAYHGLTLWGGRRP